MMKKRKGLLQQQENFFFQLCFLNTQFGHFNVSIPDTEINLIPFLEDLLLSNQTASILLILSLYSLH